MPPQHRCDLREARGSALPLTGQAETAALGLLIQAVVPNVRLALAACVSLAHCMLGDSLPCQSGSLLTACDTTSHWQTPSAMFAGEPTC